MSVDRCRHSRVTFNSRCEIFRCYECEPLTHEQTVDLVDALRSLAMLVEEQAEALDRRKDEVAAVADLLKDIES